MLPDLWRMADRRVRPAAAHVRERLETSDDEIVRNVLVGIEHHLEADLWFHDAPVFTEGERRTAAALRSAGTTAKKLTLFAHPLWEMCLDGALVRKLGAETVRKALEEGFRLTERATRTAVEIHHLAHVDDGESYRDELHARMNWLTNELSKGPWIKGYSEASGLVRGLEGIRRRFALPPFSVAERDALAAAIDTLTEGADAGVNEILAREL